MLGGYSFGELGSILAMQGFAGLILFSVFVLMALKKAIIFGQMGVINMAHGEFMILGAYMTYLCSHLFETYLPHFYNGYFFVAMAGAFALLLYKSTWGLQVRAVVANRIMSGAVGIDTRRIDRLTFGLGCGIAGIAGSAFTMIGSTGPTAGQLYIVDTFLV